MRYSRVIIAMIDGRAVVHLRISLAIFYLLTLCPHPLLSGGFDPVSKALDNGMARLAPNTAPFGNNEDGTPLWPSDASGFPQIAHASVDNAKPTIFSATGMWNENLKGTTHAIESLIWYLNDYSFGAELEPLRVRRLISASFALEPATVVSPGILRHVRRQTPNETVQRLKKAYLIDIERHGRLVFNGKDVKALEIALKWQAITRLFPDRISEITLNVASRHGISSFEEWINIIVSKDWQAARLQGEPPQIPIFTQSSSPLGAAATIQVYDNKDCKWVETGPVIYEAMVEQGSGKYGPSPGLYFRPGGTADTAPK